MLIIHCVVDMTFTHDGNETLLENGLVNFEKMHMLAQTMRTLRYCRSRHLGLPLFDIICIHNYILLDKSNIYLFKIKHFFFLIVITNGRTQTL